MLILSVLYIFVCIVWGIFSIGMQRKIYPEDSDCLILLWVFVLNCLLCPIAIVKASFMLMLNKGWAKKI